MYKEFMVIFESYYLFLILITAQCIESYWYVFYVSLA